MTKLFKNNVALIGVVIFTVFVLISYFYLKTDKLLSFSDGAKYATIARNLVEKDRYLSDFTFSVKSAMKITEFGRFPALWTSPAVSYLYSFYFRILGVNDNSIILGNSFLFLFLVLFTFLLSRKLFDNKTAILSSLSVALSTTVINYTLSGATEIVFMLEIILGMYLISFKKKWLDFLSAFVLVVMYYTRPQAIIFVLPLFTYWYFLNKKKIKDILYLVLMLTVFLLAANFLLPNDFVEANNIRSFVARMADVVFKSTDSGKVSVFLRGGAYEALNSLGLIKKVFYNLYNFYKLIPSTFSPYLFTMFVFGIFIKFKKNEVKTFKIVVLLMLLSSYLVASLTIPFSRYIHPVLPMIYIISSAAMVWIVKKTVNGRWQKIRQIMPRFIKKANFTILLSLLLLVFFLVGQTLGDIFLDSRYENIRKNSSKLPARYLLAQRLKENTQKGDLIVTNLDTWASWYGDRKTVWFPSKPLQIGPADGQKNEFDAIYLTSYFIDDENYYMGEDWRQIFNNPEDSDKWICAGCRYIKDNYLLKLEVFIPASEDYENVEERGILLVKKK